MIRFALKRKPQRTVLEAVFGFPNSMGPSGHPTLQTRFFLQSEGRSPQLGFGPHDERVEETPHPDRADDGSEHPPRGRAGSGAEAWAGIVTRSVNRLPLSSGDWRPHASVGKLTALEGVSARRLHDVGTPTLCSGPAPFRRGRFLEDTVFAQNAPATVTTRIATSKVCDDGQKTTSNHTNLSKNREEIRDIHHCFCPS
jgi:hypothetical protein